MKLLLSIFCWAFTYILFAASSVITLNSTNPVSGIAIVVSTDVTNAAVTAAPANVTVLTNSDVEFTAAASGNLLSYYWITNSTLAVDGSTLSGATTTSLILSNVVIGQSNMPVAFIVSNYCGSVTSAVATLTVTNSPGGGGGGAWSPTNEASLIVWQEADVGVTNTSDALAADGDLVKGWRDQGPLHKDSTNLLGTGGIYKTGIQNGLPAIRFEQTNLFRCDGLTALVQGNDMPLVFAIVYRNENSGSAAGILWEAIDPGGSTKQNSFNLNSAGVRQYVRYDGTTQKVDQGGTANTSWETLILISTGTTATIYTNGVVCGTADQDVDVNSLTATQFSIGHNDAGTYFKGEVGGWMMFTNSAVAMTNIQTYLKSKWATP